MSNNEYLSQMRADGYFIYPQALSAQESIILGESALPELEKINQFAIPTIDFVKSDSISQYFFNERIREILCSIFDNDEEIFILPNLTIRNSLYINWHTDDFFLKSPIEKSIDLPEFYMFNLYLQSNSPETGGGLDIISGSQKLSAEEKLSIIESNIDNNEHTVSSEMGDLIVFDYRVIHRGTQAIDKPRNTRLAMQWTVSNSKEHVERFVDYLLSRRTKKVHLSDYVENKATDFFNKLDKCIHPHSFSVEQRKFFDNRIKFVNAI